VAYIKLPRDSYLLAEGAPLAGCHSQGTGLHELQLPPVSGQERVVEQAVMFAQQV
jgi:hypothetical protein